MNFADKLKALEEGLFLVDHYVRDENNQLAQDNLKVCREIIRDLTKEITATNTKIECG